MGFASWEERIYWSHFQYTNFFRLLLPGSDKSLVSFLPLFTSPFCRTMNFRQLIYLSDKYEGMRIWGLNSGSEKKPALLLHVIRVFVALSCRQFRIIFRGTWGRSYRRPWVLRVRAATRGRLGSWLVGAPRFSRKVGRDSLRTILCGKTIFWCSSMMEILLLKWPCSIDAAPAK